VADEKENGKGGTENEGMENERLSESVMKSGSGMAENERECFYCLSIIGQIEGHYTLEGNQKATKYDHLLPLLVALEESDKIDGILILLNTMGGDVEAGLAISEVIASLTKPTVSVVLGGGHSIGVPLAVSAERSFIVPSATMTIHPVRTTGTIIGVPQSFDYLRQMQDRIIDFVASHSRVKPDYLREIMMRTDQMANDVGSVIDGREAVACGLIDAVGGIRDALSALRELCGIPEPNRRGG
jgi:ATP-dependent protease ClpP protease subunit